MGKKVSKDRVEIKNAIEVNQEQIKSHLGELVRQSVEETLNGLLDAARKLGLSRRDIVGRVEDALSDASDAPQASTKPNRGKPE